ncbi:MAG TPA: DoxX family protein [Terracidiphilus sp.]|nr:DoxX family protein [Terracidiphilus sp.]
MTTNAMNEPSAISPSVPDTTTPAVVRAGNGRRLAGRILTGLTILFLLFDAVGKIVVPPQVTAALVRLGIPVNLSMTIAVMLLFCTVFYAIPRTAVFGAVLLTGFLGGAVAIQLRVGSAVFETMFPILLAIVAWAGVYLRECRLAQIFPVRR